MKLSMDWISGFVDGEGCFYVGIQKHPEMSIGYQILPEFTVVQHKDNIQILYALKSFFGCGTVRKNHSDRYAYRVRKLKCLLEICDLFNKHPLKTKKNVEMKKFRKVILIMIKGEHLTKEGMLRIINIAERMNTCNRKNLQNIKNEILLG